MFTMTGIMFKEAFEKLDLADVATIVDRLNPLFEGKDFDPVDTVIMALDLPFYPGYRLFDISDHSGVPSSRRFALSNTENDIVLNFTNEPIYNLNKDLPIKLTADTVADYVRFFFTYVRGRHGRFLIAETVEDIPWREDPPPAAKKTIGKMLSTLVLKDNGLEGHYNMNVTMIFKDSLFKSDVSVTSTGFVSLDNEELLIEDMPVLDDILGE